MKCGWQLSWPTRWKLRSTLGHVESTYKQWTQCGKLLMFDEQLKDGRGHSMKVSVAVSLSKREKRFSLFRHKSGTPVCISLFRSEKKINPCLQSSKKKSKNHNDWKRKECFPSYQQTTSDRVGYIVDSCHSRGSCVTTWFVDDWRGHDWKQVSNGIRHANSRMDFNFGLFLFIISIQEKKIIPPQKIN